MKMYTCPGCKQEALKPGGDSPENGRYPYCTACGWTGQAYVHNTPKARAARLEKLKKVSP